jgi:hypothetical protein
MLWITALFGIVFILSGIGVILLIRTLTRFNQVRSLSMETVAELSIDRYRPMLRLLSDDDLRFLRVQPGFTPDMASQLRRQRCKIFRGYLKCLEMDFRSVCGALKLLLLESRYDRPDLASTLVRAQVSFAAGLAAVQFRLVLFQWGLSDVDAVGLLKLFDAMRLELRTLIPVRNLS